MKIKIKLILLLMISITHFINAQSSWWHTAGELRTGVANANTGSLLFYNSGNANSVKIQSGATSATHTLTLPTTQGAANTVLMNNGSGTLTWQNAGGIGAWSLIGNAGTTAGTNFIGTTDPVDFVIKTNNTEKMRVQSGGNVGIGTTTPVNSLQVSKNIDVDGTVGVMSNGTIQSAVTSNASYFRTTAATAASFTLSHMFHYRAVQGTFGSGSVVTTQYGFAVHSSLTGATNNYGFYGEIAAGTGRYNCYMGGTAKNYFAGEVGVGNNAPAVLMDLKGDNVAYGGQLRLASTDVSQITFYNSGALTLNATNRLGDIYYNVSNSTLHLENHSGNEYIILNQSGGNVGIGLTNPAYKLDVNGALNVTGDINGTGSFNYTSDQMFKKEIDSISNALSIIQELKPRTYYFDTLNFSEFNFSSKKRYGFIAQDLEQVLPELVKQVVKHADYDTLGNIVHPETTFKTVNYIEIIAILTKGIQELEFKNDNLQSKVNNQDSINVALQENNTALQNQINNLVANGNVVQNQLNQLLETINGCCNATTRSMQIGTSETQTSQQTDVKLKDVQSIVLEQNVPNPFAEQSTINYTLPDNTVKAQILFYNSQGKLIQSTELTQKGSGQLNVFASDLSNGIYTYTLVVDGRIVDSKKMIRNK